MAEDEATAPAESDDEGSVRELRLALVCYGGVSLAIYMHGTTKEIHKLVIASEGRRHSRAANPFPEETTEHVYWEVLRELQSRDPGGIPTRVVVDIISGTSAGGINGVFLAKALAGNQDQQGLRELWLKQGDIHKLTKPKWVRPVGARLGLWMVAEAWKPIHGKPPLDGNFLLKQAYGALSGMNVAPVQIGASRPDTLMPQGHDLRLFVTTTDFHGYDRLAPAYAPIQVPSAWHRHVYAFERTADHDAFGPAYDPALAFAARSTSSFPGAFPPAHLDDVHDVLHTDLPPGFDDEFFPTYKLAGRRAEDAWFVDGGVLDNFPFRAAIEAIFQMPASSEVDRRLVYIEPDPAAPDGPTPSSKDPPGFLQTVFSSLSSIPANQPIAGALFDLRDFNDRVDRVSDVVDQTYGAIERAVSEVTRQSHDSVGTLNAAVHEQATEGGPAYTAYVRLKVRAVVDALATAAASLCGFPPETDQAGFVGDVVTQWAETSGPLRPGVTDDEVATFLRTFDLGYAERRLKFVLKGVNALYTDIHMDGETAPTRAQLDDAKAQLWHLIGRITAPAAALRSPSDTDEAVVPLKRQVRSLFSAKDVDAALHEPGSAWDGVVTAFAQPRVSQLDRLGDALGAYLNKSLDGFGDEMFDTFTHTTEKWSEAARHDLTVRYVGFPLWDGVLYPMQRVSELGELNRVEVIRMSPRDATLLNPAEDKLSGVAIHHFGAFFHPDGRANDYVWGRLDGAERLIWLLLHGAVRGDAAAFDQGAFERFSRQAFAAVASEEATLRGVAREPFDAITKSQRQAAPAPRASSSAGS